MQAVAIINPSAGHFRAGRMWPRLVGKLQDRLPPLTTWWTKAPGQAESLAARARRQGYDRVVAVGGDGTLFEVANGLWWEAQGPRPSLGFVPLGTGCDYARNFPQGTSLEDLLLEALGEATLEVGVGVIQVLSPQGQPLRRICLNVLGLGFDAQVVGRLRRQKLPLGGKIPYLLSGLQELCLFRKFRLTGLMDGEPFASHSSLLVVGLGRFFGGGMQIAPGASPVSGRFQVVWDQGLTPLTIIYLLSKIYSGRHLGHPRVNSRFARRLEVEAAPPALVQVEGEPVGRTPLTAWLAPETLRLAGSGSQCGPGSRRRPPRLPSTLR